MASRRPLQTGRLIDDRYTLEAQLRGPGMGEVWLASDTQFRGRRVRLKFLTPAAGLDSEEFLSGARALQRLRHRGVLHVVGQGIHAEVPFLVHEEGPSATLEDWLDELRANNERPTLREAWDVFAQASAAVQAAHAILPDPIVHSAITPAAIVVDRRADGGRSVWVCDFGIVAFDELGSERVGRAPGYTEYLAPEQLDAYTEPPATDVFALAVVLLEVLSTERTAKRPWALRSREGVNRAQLEPLREGVPGPVWDVLVRALDAFPSRRHGSAGALLRALADVWPEPVELPELVGMNTPARTTGAIEPVSAPPASTPAPQGPEPYTGPKIVTAGSALREERRPSPSVATAPLPRPPEVTPAPVPFRPAQSSPALAAAFAGVSGDTKHGIPAPPAGPNTPGSSAPIAPRTASSASPASTASTASSAATRATVSAHAVSAAPASGGAKVAPRGAATTSSAATASSAATPTLRPPPPPPPPAAPAPPSARARPQHDEPTAMFDSPLAPGATSRPEVRAAPSTSGNPAADPRYEPTAMNDTRRAAELVREVEAAKARAAAAASRPNAPPVPGAHAAAFRATVEAPAIGGGSNRTAGTHPAAARPPPRPATGSSPAAFRATMQSRSVDAATPVTSALPTSPSTLAPPPSTGAPTAAKSTAAYRATVKSPALGPPGAPRHHAASGGPLRDEPTLMLDARPAAPPAAHMETVHSMEAPLDLRALGPGAGNAPGFGVRGLGASATDASLESAEHTVEVSTLATHDPSNFRGEATTVLNTEHLATATRNSQVESLDDALVDDDAEPAGGGDALDEEPTTTVDTAQAVAQVARKASQMSTFRVGVPALGAAGAPHARPLGPPGGDPGESGAQYPSHLPTLPPPTQRTPGLIVARPAGPATGPASALDRPAARSNAELAAAHRAQEERETRHRLIAMIAGAAITLILGGVLIVVISSIHRAPAPPARPASCAPGQPGCAPR